MKSQMGDRPQQEERKKEEKTQKQRVEEGFISQLKDSHHHYHFNTEPADEIQGEDERDEL